MTDLRPPRLIDYHMHSGVTIDAKMSEADACERARAQGINEIAFTNHMMLNQPNYMMSKAACLAHRDRIQECQEQYPEIKIRLGVEMDYYPGREQEIAETLREYEALLGRPFDLVLGSIHEMNGVFFSNKHQAPALYKDRNAVSLYCEYFAVATQAVRSRLFDVMAHPDLIKKFTHELSPRVAFAEYRAAVDPYVEALIETGTGMEVNTKGLKLKVHEAYPSNELLELYVSKARLARVDPILTIGSDAHSADDVGAYLPAAVATLRSLGIEELSVFDGQKRSTWKM